MDIPNPITPAYELPGPNEPLVLYKGAATYNGRRGRAVVRLQLHPKVDVQGEFDEADGPRPVLADSGARRWGK